MTFAVLARPAALPRDTPWQDFRRSLIAHSGGRAEALRDEEREADRGARRAAREAEARQRSAHNEETRAHAGVAAEGYQRREALGFWERFAEYKDKHGGGKQIEFLSTHPAAENRIAELQALAPRMMPL